MPAASFQIVPATLDHAREMAPRMRSDDVAEVMASGGYAPFEALALSVSESEEAWTLSIRGQVAAIWGVMRMKDRPRAGVVWLLTSTVVDRHPILFLRVCVEELAAMRARWSVLVNAIDARYHKALTWARWLGFEVAAPQPFGKAGLPFCPIKLGGLYV